MYGSVSPPGVSGHAAVPAAACVTSPGQAVLASPDQPAPFLAFVAGLREQTSHARALTWHLRLTAELDLTPLHHLCPPSPGPAAAVGAWRRAYQPGLRYYRRGPGFVVICDNRPAASPAQVVIADPRQLALFDALHDPGPADPEDPAAIGLGEAGLIFWLGGLSVMPVGRLRRLVLPRNMM